MTLVITACGPVTPVPQVVPTTASLEITEPPTVTLTVDGVSQEGGIGPFCWHAQTEKTGSNFNCVDVFGIPTAQEPLILKDFLADAEFRISHTLFLIPLSFPSNW